MIRALSLLLAFGLSATPALAGSRDRLAAAPAPPRAFAAGATHQACFTPGMDCEGMVVAVIDGAVRTLLFQAYEFSSNAIAEALVRAHRRGVGVIAVVDKKNRTVDYSRATFLTNQGVPVVIDEEPAIAHNKVIVADDGTAAPVVLTGSYNFTAAAQHRNAENVLVVRGDPALAAAYAAHIRQRQRLSVRLDARYQAGR